MKKAANVPIPIDGRKLHDRLVRRGITTQEAAAAVGVPYRKAVLWVNGGAEIDPVHLYHLAKLLRCKMSALVPDDFQEKEEKGV